MHAKGNSCSVTLTGLILDAVSLVFKAVALCHLLWRRLHCKKYPALVVSIDNLSFGGTGKTTLVKFLGQQLVQKKIKFAIITRGYKSNLENQNIRVLPTHSPADIGDEATIYKNNFPDPAIYIGKDRQKSISMAIRDGYRLLLMDDGFQSAHIYRAIKIMLINPAHPYYYLRHFRFLAQSETFLLFFRNEATHAQNRPAKKAGKEGPTKGQYDLRLRHFCDLQGNTVDIGASPLVGFSALGDNGRFQADLAAFNLAAFKGYKDHHAYTEKDLQELDSLRQQHNAAYLVCTEKDMIKIKAMNLQNIPLIYAANSIELGIDILGYILDLAEKENYLQPSS